MADTCKWDGYEFGIYGQNTDWNAVGGIYIFTGLNQANQWVPLYIGQASSLAERLATHERLLEARSLGATHIHARVVATQSDRDSLERHLIQKFQPRLNSQLK